MGVFTWPTDIPPFSVDPELVDSSQLFDGPAGAVVTDAGDAFWRLQWRIGRHQARRGEIMGLLARLRGPCHRAIVPIFESPKNGTLSGTPLVMGAAQTGDTLETDGWGTNEVVVAAGDYFSVNNELKIAALDANSNGSGEATLTFNPPLRASPADDAAIEVDEPVGQFIMISLPKWKSFPGIVSSFNAEWLEDVFL